MSLKSSFLRWRVKRRIRLTKRTLAFIDRKLGQMKVPSWKRQQIRRDIIASDEAWVDFVNLLGDKS